MNASERKRSDFATTQWSLVVSLRDGTPEEAQEALVDLCRRYWFPLYAFARRSGHNREDAQDLTQGFFAEFLSKGYFSRANPRRGRFRNFLVASLKNFMNEQWSRERAQRRGGGISLISWDQIDAERRYASELTVEVTPEILYDRQWARTIMDRVLANLERDFSRRNKAKQFQQIKQYLWGEARGMSYTELAEQAQMSVSAFKSAVHRVRGQHRDLLRAEVAHTVADLSEVDDELRHLVAVLSQGQEDT